MMCVQSVSLLHGLAYLSSCFTVMVGFVQLLHKVSSFVTLSCHRLVVETQEAAQEEEWDQEAGQSLVEVQIQVVQHLAAENLVAEVD